jgi:hypothetical protein
VAGAGKAQAVYRIDAVSRAATLLIPPPVLSLEHCVPENAAGCQPVVAVGCDPAAPACLDGSRPRCLVAYGRLGDDGLAHPYVWAVAYGHETELSEEAPVDGFYVSPDQHTLLWRSPTALEGGENRLWFLDACAGKVDRCRTFSGTPPVLKWRPDGRAFGAMLGASGDLLSVSVPEFQCARVGLSRQIGAFAFSPDSRRLAWLDLSDREMPSLWVGDGLGYGRGQVAVGDFSYQFEMSPSSERIFVGHAGDGSLSLGWFDLSADEPGPEHVITTSRSTVRIGDRRVLLLSSWNRQDGAGDLELVDLDGEYPTALRSSVTAFQVRGGVDEAATVVYVVRERYPSCRDGIWVTTLPPAPAANRL